MRENVLLRTYVKVEGENVEIIVQNLARIAVDTPDICVWDENMLHQGWLYPAEGMPVDAGISDYFGMNKDDFDEECDRIIAVSEAELGKDNIYFEWLIEPTNEQLLGLMKQIDAIIKPFGNKYTITNRE